MIPLKNFVAEIVKHGGINNASKKLYISQPSLSIRLKRLESEIGMPLFNRNTNPISPTPAGELYLEALQKVNSIQSELECAISDLITGEGGTFSIGGAHFVTSYLLVKLINGFKEKYPNEKINLMEGKSLELEEMLKNGGINLVVDYAFSGDTFIKEPILEEHILLCVPKKYVKSEFLRYGLTRNDIINGKHLNTQSCDILSAIKNEEFILMRKGNDMYNHSSNILREKEISPNIVLETDQLVTAYEAAVNGFGITFTTDQMVKAVDDKGAVLYYKIDSSSSVRTLFIARNKNNYFSNSQKRFIMYAVDYKAVNN